MGDIASQRRLAHFVGPYAVGAFREKSGDFRAGLIFIGLSLLFGDTDSCLAQESSAGNGSSRTSEVIPEAAITSVYAPATGRFRESYAVRLEGSSGSSIQFRIRSP